MNSHTRRINRNMITGWLIIVIVLFITYVGEVIKGERTLGYLLAFLTAVILPALIVYIIYRRKPDWEMLQESIKAPAL